jgi:transposase InsO family protein
MQIGRVLPRGAGRLVQWGEGLSEEATRRLKWIQHYEERGRNAARTCRHFDISRQTFYRWWRRFQHDGPLGLEGRSRRPRRRRQPTWSAGLEQAVLALRRQFPRWGKDKLAVLVRREGYAVSTSMVGRILRRLRQRGVLVEPARRAISARKRRPPRPYAVRKPRDYQPRQPGDLVQLDTLDVRPLPGVVLKHFTARDVVSRWDVVEVHARATATTATAFLDTLQARMPFPIRAIQIDGGSEFQAQFEQACQHRGIRLFALPPRSPKLNGAVERAQRTHTEEFYEVYDLPWTTTTLNQHARQWEHTYNTIRPHQALGYRTPAEFLAHLARGAPG